MPKAKALTSLSGLIGSDIEDNIQDNDADMTPPPDSDQENAEPLKKERGNPKAKTATTAKVRKTKPVSRRLSGGRATKAKAVAKKTRTQRAPLKEQTNEERESDIEEVDDLQKKLPDKIDTNPPVSLEKESETIPQEKKAPGRRGKPGGKSKLAIKQIKEDTIAEHAAVIEKDGEFEYTPTTTRQGRGIIKGSALSKKTTRNQRHTAADPQPSQREVPETQPVPMELDQSGLPGEEDEDEEALPQSVYKQSNHARAPSKQRLPSVVRKRTGSTSDTERTGNDPALRRKLGEMTKKLETLDLKYRNLREVGIIEAETNFEKLKKQAEERAKAANNLIASLKLELSTQRTQAQESRSLRTQLSAANTSLATTQANNTQLTTSLTEAQNEIKTLQVKLTARASSATTETGYVANARTPGSAFRGRVLGRGNVMGKEEATKAEMAILKEELYSDLTGLILRGVERGDQSDVYDCIQTGRNGTLHFHLTITHTPPPSTTTPGPSSNIPYDEVEFQYTPRLDASRDRELLELLPDYLTEEITFSRANAGRFYARVGEVMQKKREVEATESE